jgi:hypothetical protein
MSPLEVISRPRLVISEKIIIKKFENTIKMSEVLVIVAKGTVVYDVICTYRLL